MLHIAIWRGRRGARNSLLSPSRFLNELIQRPRQFATLIGAVLAQSSGYLFGNVANPPFRGVKANYSNRVAILAFLQILDDSLKIGVFNVSLAPGATHAAKVVEYQKNIPVDAGELSRVRYPFHTSTQLNMIQKTSLRIWFLLSKEL